MATLAGDFTVNVRLVPDNQTMEVVLKMLDLWQDEHPHQMVTVDNGHYRIVNVEGR